MTLDSNTQETNSGAAEIFGMKPNTFCMMLHLSQLFNFWVPPCGIVLPIVLWAIGKDKSPQVDQHGKIILNWLISLFVYMAIGVVVAIGGVIFSILVTVAIGFSTPIGLVFFGAIASLLGIPAIIFPVIGALKANEGTAWDYPLSIRWCA